jgi:hypothetical protein
MRLPTFRSCLAGLILLLAVPASADYLGGITFSHPTPGYLPHSEFVVVTIDYKVDAAGGGRVFILPFSGGAPTPSYAVSGGPLVGPGTGTVNLQFRITAGNHVVDQVRVRLVSPDQSQLWLELFLPVHFIYGPSGIFTITPSRSEHSALRHEQRLDVDFAYEVSDPAGCRIFARPYTDGALTPGYAASGSAVLPQSGSASQWFSFDDDADVTHIHFRVANHDNSATLLEFDMPYALHWRAIGVYDISFDRDYESSLHNTQNLTASFTIDHLEAGGARVWARCTTDGAITPGGAYQPSILEPVGAHAVSRYCRVNSGAQAVDAIRFSCEAGDVTSDFLVPVRAFWGPHAVNNQVFTPAAPAIFANGERLEMAFDYVTSEADDVRIFVRPALDYDLLFGINSAGSPGYPPPAGDGDFWVTFNSGHHVADSMRFLMTNADQSADLLTFFKHGHWVWGAVGTITPVPADEVVAAASLGAIHPNPFNPTAVVPLQLAVDATIRLVVYDVRGRMVQVLTDGPLPAGRHDLRFDGTGLASGTYLCRLDGPGGVQTRRMTLVR